MFASKKNREDRRYYLLPGMGRSNKRRFWQILKWAVVVGVIAATLFGYALYRINRL